MQTNTNSDRPLIIYSIDLTQALTNHNYLPMRPWGLTRWLWVHYPFRYYLLLYIWFDTNETPHAIVHIKRSLILVSTVYKIKMVSNKANVIILSKILFTEFHAYNINNFNSTILCFCNTLLKFASVTLVMHHPPLLPRFWKLIYQLSLLKIFRSTIRIFRPNIGLFYVCII